MISADDAELNALLGDPELTPEEIEAQRQAYEDKILRAQRDLAATELELIERELCRRRLKPFVKRMTPNFLEGWHVDEICAACERLEAKIQRQTGTDARQILEAPPRHGKSQCTSRCFPLWYLGRHPEQEVIVATYNQELADEIGEWAKAAVDSDEFQTVFSNLKIRSDSKAKNKLLTNKGGAIRFVGVGAGLTGKGGHLIVIDDPIKDAADADSPAMRKRLWNWYTAVLRTRLAPGAGILVMHTRWRVDDLIGTLLTEMKRGGETFERLTFTALADKNDFWGREEGAPLHPARFTAADLEAVRKALPARDWMALYQQSPFIEGGNLFKDTDFQMYKPGTEPRGMNYYLAIDFASSTKDSADHSVVWPFGLDVDGHIWLLPNFTHARIRPHETIKRIVELCRALKPHGIAAENGQIFQSIEKDLTDKLYAAGVYCPVTPMTASVDKARRAFPLRVGMGDGKVHFPDTRYVNERVIPEFLQFSGNDDPHDDLVDAAAWGYQLAQDAIRPFKGDRDAEEDIDPTKGHAFREDVWAEEETRHDRRPHVAKKRDSRLTSLSGERKRTKYRYA